MFFGRELVGDDSFDEEEKDQISRELAGLQEDDDKLQENIDDERDR